jgi:hypothetical protein
MDSIITKIRDLTHDLASPIRDVFQYTTSAVFTLSEANVIASSIVAYKNGTLYASSNYSYNSSTGKITVTGSLVSGNTLEFDYQAYIKYSDTEIKSYIRQALIYLTAERYNTFVAKSDDTIFPTPSEAEEGLISLIATLLFDCTISSYRTPEFTVTLERDISRPMQIKRVIAQFRKSNGVLRYINPNEDTIVEDFER